ncbi:HAD-like protein [Aspergillus stella-maris]|uniref:HAD-like protein n=1 Tax=Aspergillus stella-maris TaxID=1810926 RepID=UPI003CCCFB46
MAAAGNKHVVFDVVGTLVSYEKFFSALETRLGARFASLPNPIGSRIFGYAWMEAAEKEYTYLTLSSRAAGYIPVFDVFRSLFYRTLWQAGFSEPREVASDEDREFILSAYRDLDLRPGVKECFDILSGSGYTVWCLTAGDVSRVQRYLRKGGVEFPGENFVSCDEIGVGKPQRESYEFILGKFNEGKSDEEQREKEMWFAAGHMWDAAGAKGCGFKGAWVSVWEKEACTDIFGEMDVVAEDLVGLADGIVKYSTKQ